MSTLKVNNIEPLTGTTVAIDVKDSIKTVNSISELLATPGTTEYLIRVRGYYSSNNDGGGIFRFNSSRIAENDFGTVFLGWERIDYDHFTPEMFGSTDSGDQLSYFIALRNAINVNSGGKIILKRNKLYTVSSNITFNVGNIELNGNGATVHTTNTTRTDLFQFFGTEDNNRIEKINIFGPLKLTSTYFPGAIATGNGINFKWVNTGNIVNCTMTNFSDGGISVTDSDYINILNNVVSTCAQPINIFNHSTHCVISENKVSNATVFVGISVEGFANGSSYQPDDIIVSNNQVTGFVTKGIDMQNVLRAKCTGNTVTGGTAPSNCYGIHLWGSPRIHCIDNISHDNSGYGIRCGPNCTAAIISNNTTYNNTTGSMYHDDGPGVATCYGVRLGQNAFIEGVPVQSGNVSFSGLYIGNNTSTDAKTLDWYEEIISFTPTAKGGTTTGTGTYTIQSGRLTRIGNVCLFTIDLGWSAHTGTGDLIITGLPFNSTSINTAITVYIKEISLSAGNVFQAKLTSNSNNIIITQYTWVNGGIVSPVPMDGSVAELAISGTFII